jgi:hypothetical protein
MTRVEAELSWAAGEKFRSCIDHLVGTPSRKDGLSQAQRQADALEKMCDHLMAAGKLPSLNGRQAHLTVFVREVDGGRVESCLEGVGLIPNSMAAELLRDGCYRVQTVDKTTGVVINYGRKRRIASARQREVKAGEYQTCAVRRCRKPVRQCEMHHLDEYALGGGTDLERMIPLCKLNHHRQVSEGLVRVVPQADGSVILAPPDSG